MDNIPEDIPDWLIDMIERAWDEAKARDFDSIRVIEARSIGCADQCISDIDIVLSGIEKTNVEIYKELT